MAAFKNIFGPLFLVALIVVVVSHAMRTMRLCHIDSFIHEDALPLPASCYNMKLPKCTKETCYKFCLLPGGYCAGVDECCCPIS
ncbi:hypothetical protein ZWY2020_042878 [Hordeum vulgare]|nr:hypothetical protein ZWY2020_042878 [Hordeum vulgare]